MHFRFEQNYNKEMLMNDVTPVENGFRDFVSTVNVSLGAVDWLHSVTNENIQQHFKGPKDSGF